MAAVEITMIKPNVPGGSKTLNLKNPTAAAYLNGSLKPEDVILTKNGSVYVKKFKCRVCHYKAAWESEMIRHEVRVHGLDSAAKKKPAPRPIPNLIPIQNNEGGSPGSTPGSTPSKTKPPTKLATPTVLKNGLLQGSGNSGGLSYDDMDSERPLTEKDLNDIYAKSCATSSLKDFASLIGADESSLKSDRLKDFITLFADEKELEKLRTVPEKTVVVAASPVETKSEGDAPNEVKKLPDSFKKKNATFFDRLKEKLMVGAGETHNLVCWCGHKSKCLSESVLHQKTHSESGEKSEKIMNGPLISGAELSSTRCQHCRQRCKTSSDLFAHLQSCPEMIKKGNDSSCFGTSQSGGIDAAETNGNEDVPMDEDGEIEDEPDENDEFVETLGAEKEENKVFVWNNFGDDKEEGDEFPDDELRSKSPASESSLVGYEIAPGIGSVIPNNDDGNEQYKVMVDVNNTEASTKKVFKCPTCTFWASTASRFHVHIVSHLNVKPFGCSVCPYQSKWKWDVTKHIKLKKERDPTHECAEMRTIDVETGRRNYTKYNRFLTLMRVHEPHLDLLVPLKQQLPSSPAVPLLPKLTPAPSMNGGDEADAANDSIMRPLPQLHPANPTVSMKRPHDAGDDSEVPRKKMPSEKKMWKCKKCKFRNTDRNIVLAHVKEHYTNGSQSASDSRTFGTDSELGNSSSNMDTSRSANDHAALKGAFKCEFCSFETDSMSTFEAHNRHHEENPTAMFKCCFCSFYANDKAFMLNHISSHGVQNAEESLPLIANQSKKDDSEDDRLESMEDGSMNETIDSSVNKTENENGGGEEMEIYKRFKCCSCPYVTNNKSQYLYHKQFHRLRGAPFKCNICSYNVTKRHLLHQHLKIHGVKRAQFKNCIKDAVEKETPENGGGFTLNTDIDTAHLPDIPLVWVHKNDGQGGTISKMFKCRHCPHVNLRKSNIHEHEKMHFDRIQRSPNGSITTNQSSTHRCTECNYVCNNAGALASHFKVHQGTFGQICALADARRSDESQMREIKRMLLEDDRFKDTKTDAAAEQKKVAATTVEVPASSSPSSSSFAAMVEAATAPPGERPVPAVDKVLHFCNVCPARFLYQKDLESHSRFHSAHHMFKCNSCTYSAPQQAQLLAHKRVHSNEYQDKTNALCATYAVSREFARPKTNLIVEKPGFAGLGWVVVHMGGRKDDTGGAAPGKPRPVTKQFSCHKCPAQFFKSVALQHHLTLHGGKDQYQCRGCDYRVKTYGNLIKHESVHGLEPRVKIKSTKNKKPGSQGGGGAFAPFGGQSAGFPNSGTELFRHRSEQMTREQTPTPPAPPVASASLSVDPEFGILMHGSPDFVYPQTVKNGKLKEKRYKCHKCPSAFEKREQYKTHVQLHGAKSRFCCEKCDYSVKYFANYTQHMRKHETNERRLSERRAGQGWTAEGSQHPPRPMDVMSTVGLVRASVALERIDLSTLANGKAFAASAVASSSAAAAAAEPKAATSSPEKFSLATPLSTPTKSAAKTLHISVADQQAVVLMQEKIADGVNVGDQLHRCYYCPYSHQRRDAVESHERCHFQPKGSYVCEFCNYTVPQPHFLREHQKLHFGSMKGVKPEAYMKCDRLEIWMETEEGKVLIFKDSGRKENRFEPPVAVNEDDSEYKKMYVDVKTGEEFTPTKVDSDSASAEAPAELRKPPCELATSHRSEASSSPSSSSSSSCVVSPRVKQEQEVAIVTDVFAVKVEPPEEGEEEDDDPHTDEGKSADIKQEEVFLEDEEEEGADLMEEEEEEDDDDDDADGYEEAADGYDEADDSDAEDEETEEPEPEPGLTDAEFEDDSTVNEEVLVSAVRLNGDAHVELDSEMETEDKSDATSLAEELIEAPDKNDDEEEDEEEGEEEDDTTAAAEETLDGGKAATEDDGAKTDDSDSEDSESDSSSSSSCSGSSCSSSSSDGPTDDEEKAAVETEPPDDVAATECRQD